MSFLVSGQTGAHAGQTSDTAPPLASPPQGCPRRFCPSSGVRCRGLGFAVPTMRFFDWVLGRIVSQRGLGPCLSPFPCPLHGQAPGQTLMNGWVLNSSTVFTKHLPRVRAGLWGDRSEQNKDLLSSNSCVGETDPSQLSQPGEGEHDVISHRRSDTKEINKVMSSRAH